MIEPTVTISLAYYIDLQALIDKLRKQTPEGVDAALREENKKLKEYFDDYRWRYDEMRANGGKLNSELNWFYKLKKYFR